MVADCPADTPEHLSARCVKASEYTYLMDIPVVSATTDSVYTNIFCARCHRDVVIEEFSFDIMCSRADLNDTRQLANMTYLPGTLSWTTGDALIHGSRPARSSLSTSVGSDNHNRRHSRTSWLENPVSDSHNTCNLIINYGESVGRSCELNLVDECNADWPQDEIRRRCASYNYYASSEAKQYKNYDCALCNHVPEDEILCLSKFYPVDRNVFPRPPPSLTDLFTVDGDCEEDQVWDALYRRCEHVSCGYLFTLQDGECVSSNRTAGKDGRSYLNSTCYTTEFKRNYSVMFPNQSIYLNFTEKLYDFGEYEFVNHSWVRVCRPETLWTPAMNIISTVLISISLVCMLLHILIFFALPRRQNIPSMNLFSMTCSLFIAELFFVCLFRLNENYPACVAISTIMYYFLSASFLWMNVMSIDICRTFHSNRYKIKSKKIFIQYSVYAWTVPLLSTVIAVLVDQFSSETFILTPQFGTHNCWFNNKWGLVAFFTFPSGLVVLFNMVLYGISVYDIYKQHMSGEFASSTVRKNGPADKKKREKERETFLKRSAASAAEAPPKDKSSDESDSSRYADRIKERIQRRIQAHKKQRIRLVLYCKLALIMGMTWIFAFVSIHTQSLVFEYLFIIFNGLQGTFIFIAFDCKQKQWEELKQRFRGGTVLQGGTKSASSTKQTSVKTSSTGAHYKYRWSSNQRQNDRPPWHSPSAQEQA